MLGFRDSIMLLLAFKGIGFPLSGAGEEPRLLYVRVCVDTISATRASRDTQHRQGLQDGLKIAEEIRLFWPQLRQRTEGFPGLEAELSHLFSALAYLASRAASVGGQNTVMEKSIWQKLGE